MAAWITLFGQEGGSATEAVRKYVEKWADESGHEYVFKEVGAVERAEYNLQVVPTLRTFDPSIGQHRKERRGVRDIARLVGSDE